MDVGSIDLNELIKALSGLAAAIVTLGVFISRYTKSDSDDKFFGRVATGIGLKSLPPKSNDETK